MSPLQLRLNKLTSLAFSEGSFDLNNSETSSVDKSNKKRVVAKFTKLMRRETSVEKRTLNGEVNLSKPSPERWKSRHKTWEFM